jgi:hypothetical protein
MADENKVVDTTHGGVRFVIEKTGKMVSGTGNALWELHYFLGFPTNELWRVGREDFLAALKAARSIPGAEQR